MEPLPLHSLHEAMGAHFSEIHGREIIADYRSVDQEYAAASSGLALLDLSFRQMLRLAGDDRTEFLQGMVTGDIKGLGAGSAMYTAMLTPKGGMVADARVLNADDHFLLQLEPGRATAVREFLQQHIVSEEVEVSDVSERFGLLALLGPEAASGATAIFGKLATPDSNSACQAAQFEGERVWVIKESTWGNAGLTLWAPRARIGELAKKALEVSTRSGTGWIGFEASEVLRVEAGVPRFGADMDESTIPLEANLQRAISYDKGCYIGQEVIARATYRGHINRKLVGLLLGEGLLPPRAELLHQGKSVGWTTSAVRSPSLARALALGYVHRDHWEPGTRLEIAGYPDGATVHALPFHG